MSRAFIHGTPNASPSYTIDGVRAGSSTHQNARDDTAPIPEMVQEFRLDTNTNAEHGWDSGVAITLIFKSGTNDFHGDLFWYFRNDILDARPWLAPSKSVTRQNDYGFVLGGPIWKNRMFFFAGSTATSCGPHRGTGCGPFPPRPCAAATSARFWAPRSEPTLWAGRSTRAPSTTP